MGEKKDIYIGTAQAAKDVGFTSRTIERYIKTGKLKAKVLGRRYLILESDWKEFKARNIKDVA